MIVDTPDFEALRTLPADLLAKLGADSPSPGALTKLRTLVGDGDLYRLAADLPRARHKLRNKLLHAAESFADIPRAEMATARPVALWRMARALNLALDLAGPVGGTATDAAIVARPAAAVPSIRDLGCGVGADFCALLELCRAWQCSPADCVAFERDAFAAWCARANATLVWPAEAQPATDARRLVRESDVTVAGEAGRAPFERSSVVFLDPTRRAGGRRTVNDWSQCEPADSLWLPWAVQGQPMVVKVAPAFDWRSFQSPAPAQIEAVEWHGEVHELALWWNLPTVAAGAPPEATLVGGASISLTHEPFSGGLTRRNTPRAGGPGRRATVLHGAAGASIESFPCESLFLGEGQDDLLRRTMDLRDGTPQAGDTVAIPAPAVLRVDLLPALAAALHAPLWAGQPNLLGPTGSAVAAAAASRLATTGTVAAVVAAREKELRRALKGPLAGRRWQPQVLGLKGAPGADALVRLLDHAFAQGGRSGGGGGGNGDRNAVPAGTALYTRFHQSHLVLFLEPVSGTRSEVPASGEPGPGNPASR
ncbi:MAG: hypothetical protein ACREJ2_15555 [Planctomycetota bacterium]